MKPLHFLLATCVLPVAPALAALSDAPTTTQLTPAAVPQIDARAVALMNQSVKAYAALNRLSQKFTVSSSKNGEVQPEGSGQGTLIIQKPGSARLEAKIGEQDILFVSDGSTLVEQVKPTEYQQQEIKRNSIERVVGTMPSSADVPLTLLLGGENPITSKSIPQWQSAQLSSRDGLQGVVLIGPSSGQRKPATFGFYLDPKTHLLARVEASVQRTLGAGQPEITLSEVTNFAPNDAAITPANFRYVPGLGVERFYAYDKNLVVGAPPFALTGQTLGGQTISFDRYKGRVVLLDFWATWCGPCRAELPNLLANYKNYHPWGFDIVGVSLDEAESEATLRRFVAANRMNWPQLFDESPFNGPNATTYGIKAIPFTLLIGKDGKIAAINPRGEDLEPEIRDALMK